MGGLYSMREMHAVVLHCIIVGCLPHPLPLQNAEVFALAIKANLKSHLATCSEGPGFSCTSVPKHWDEKQAVRWWNGGLAPSVSRFKM